MTYKVTLTHNPDEPHLYHGVATVAAGEGKLALMSGEDKPVAVFAPGAWLSVELVPAEGAQGA